MASNSSRMRTIFRTKTSKALDKIEDPRDLLDDSYDQQVKLLQQVRQALAEVATAKKRTDLQGQELGQRYQRLGAQAKEALDQGREDLARSSEQLLTPADARRLCHIPRTAHRATLVHANDVLR